MFTILWGGLLPHHYQAEKVVLQTYFSLCSTVPSKEWSRGCGEDWGRGGGDDSRVGSREVRPRAPGALYTPLPIPPAVLPKGKKDVSEFPLPSILKCWKEKQIKTLWTMLLSIPHLNDSSKFTFFSWRSQQKGPKSWDSLQIQICLFNSFTNCY